MLEWKSEKFQKKVGNLGCFIHYLGKCRIFYKNLRKLGKLGKLEQVGALREREISTSELNCGGPPA